MTSWVRQSLSNSVPGVLSVSFIRRFPRSVDIARAST
jgi:hypothetical protein